MIVQETCKASGMDEKLWFQTIIQVLTTFIVLHIACN